MPSLLRRPVWPRCSALSRSFLSGQALRSGGYMAAITKRGQARSAKSQCPRFEGNPARTRLAAIGAAAVIPALVSGMLGSTRSGTPHDSGLVACAYPLATQDVSAAEYTTLRAEFAGSRFPDLRSAGRAYVDLAMQLLHARGTDGYETVWFYQRLSAACAKHGQ